DSGVTDLGKTSVALEAMQACGIPLLVHGEVTDPDVDIFDREAVFIDRHLIPLIKDFPDLNIVFEHLTTVDGVQFVESAGHSIAATITAHHLLYNRNALLAGGIKPHYYCLPILKRESHQAALITAATSGNPKFFLGTDSAPHAVNAKESSCGCAGIYTAHAAIEFYAQAFEAANSLEKLEAFASHFGSDFYGLPRNSGHITLSKEKWTIPDDYPLAGSTLVPLSAGQALDWRLAL
ncbi:MAG: dihydroorotase, partial [Gammaproteobacteria bacterium]